MALIHQNIFLHFLGYFGIDFSICKFAPFFPDSTVAYVGVIVVADLLILPVVNRNCAFYLMLWMSFIEMERVPE